MVTQVPKITVVTHAKRFKIQEGRATGSCCLVGFVILLLALVSVVSSPFAAAAGGSYTFSYGGRLIESNGRPVEGPISLQVSFYQTATAGSPTLTVTDGLGTVPLQEGVFQFSLVLSGSDFHAAFPSVSQAVYIEITDLTNRPDTPYDRQLVTIVPYAAKVPVDGSTLEFNSQGELTLKSSATGGQTAITSINAASSGTIAAARLPTFGGDLSGTLDAATVGKLQGRPVAATAPNNDEYLKWNGTSWIPSALAGLSGGTVSSVATGQGLSGGPITASGTINLRLNSSGGLSKTLGTGTDELGIASGGVTPTMLSNSGCNTDGKILKVSAGVWTCGDDIGLASGAVVNGDIAAGAAIVDSKLATISTAGKVADTALSSNVTKLGTDIDLSSTEVTNTLPMGKGGTGATTLTGIAVGNGTSAMTAVAGTSGQYLRRNVANSSYEFSSLGDAATKNTGTGSGDVAAGNHGHANAVAAVSSGFMSATDKTALDGLSSGALLDSDFSSQGIMLRGASAGSYAILTDNSSSWNTAYTDRLKWDGVAVGGGTSGELAAARSTLGLGSMATQAANSVSITGGTISGVAISSTGITDGADATAITIDSSEQVGVGTVSPSVRLHAATDDAATTTVTDILKLNHSSSGTPAASFGSGLLFSGESDTTDGQDMARIQSIWSTATHASRESKLQFQTLTGAGALATKMTIDGSGNVGIGTASPTGLLNVNGQVQIQSFGRLNLNQVSASADFDYGGVQSIIRAKRDGVDKFIVFGNGVIYAYSNINLQSPGSIGYGGHLLNWDGAYHNFNSVDVNIKSGRIRNTLGGLEMLPKAGSNAAVSLSGTGDFVVNSSQLYVDTSTGSVGVGTASPSKALDVNSDSIRVRTAKTPTSATAACDQGEIAWDATFIYVCVATNTWTRAAMSSW